MILGEVKAQLASLRVQPTLLKQSQKEDPKSERIKNAIHNRRRKYLKVDDEGIIRNGSRTWVQNVKDLRKEIMKEAYSSAYSIHPVSTKMYQDMKQYYWWENMKNDVAEYVSKCLTCQ